MFFAIFFLFPNTGPSTTALPNVSLPAVRATAFAANILVIHALGDVQAFWLLGYIGGHTNMRVAFLFVSGIILLSGVAWLIGVKYLPADTAAVEVHTSRPANHAVLRAHCNPQVNSRRRRIGYPYSSGSGGGDALSGLSGFL